MDDPTPVTTLTPARIADARRRLTRLTQNDGTWSGPATDQALHGLLALFEHFKRIQQWERATERIVLAPFVLSFRSDGGIEMRWIDTGVTVLVSITPTGQYDYRICDTRENHERIAEARDVEIDVALQCLWWIQPEKGAGA